jgi:hypothetical protein
MPQSHRWGFMNKVDFRHLAAFAAMSLLGWVGLAWAPARAQELRFEQVAIGLEHPWAVAFLPQGRFLVTERAGRLRVVEANGKLGPPVAGLPEIVVAGQGGLLDLVSIRGLPPTARSISAFRSPVPGATARPWPGPACPQTVPAWRTSG